MDSTNGQRCSLRQALFGSGPVLGVAPAPSYTFSLCYSCWTFFKGGMSAINLLISEEYHRAAPGGSGGVKAIGNYAPWMMPSKKAKAKGICQRGNLFGCRDTYLHRRGGAANFFCVKDKVLYTPELTGTILPGITRMSIIELARSRGYKVVEEKVSAEFAMSADEAFVVARQP